jgi:CDGSH-type Zn-finger protein
VTEQTKITVLDNGPYLVKGPVVLLDAEGQEFFTQRATFAQCRCGGSHNKPFCDRTLAKVGFRAAERAVREQQGARS